MLPVPHLDGRTGLLSEGLCTTRQEPVQQWVCREGPREYEPLGDGPPPLQRTRAVGHWGGRAAARRWYQMNCKAFQLRGSENS